MKTVGIISVRKKKGFALGDIFKKPHTDDFMKDEVRFVTAKAYIPRCGICMGLCFALACRKLRKALAEAGADVCVIANDSKCISARDKKAENTGKVQMGGIPRTRLLECFLDCREICKDVRIPDRLLIKDRDLTAVDTEFLSEVCMTVKSITLQTENGEKANKIADGLLYDLGICVDVTADNTKDRTSMMIDADEGCVRVADLVADGVLYDANCGGYDIDIGEVIYALGYDPGFKIKAWKSGERLLYVNKEKSG